MSETPTPPGMAHRETYGMCDKLGVGSACSECTGLVECYDGIVEPARGTTWGERWTQYHRPHPAVPPTAQIASDERVAEILDDQLTRMDGVFRTLAAAPLPTLPERPEELPLHEALDEVIETQTNLCQASGETWLPVLRRRDRQFFALRNRLEALASRLSSLEREIDGVRKELRGKP